MSRRGLGLLCILLTLSTFAVFSPARPAEKSDIVATFSIVAHDPDRKEWGVAVASKYLAVGSAVPFAKAGVGAVATQASVNVGLGPKGLELMAAGKSASEALEELKKGEKGIDSRQLGLVDAKGNAVSFTGKRCFAWAGGKTGKNYACQGNILASEKVVEAMAEAFEKYPKWPLAWRMFAALEAGEKAGGDKRGKQSAAILVVREKGGPNGSNDRSVDLRVDDHTTPIEELERILKKRMRKPAE